MDIKTEVLKSLCEMIRKCAADFAEKIEKDPNYDSWQEIALIKELSDALYNIRLSCG
ncbi:hypothetical protein EDD75_0413 [Thermodesulfitimonas autotrophica]|uniref:Uncharacterized protein n=1 Tax=Thermodesulfitimonas autotrophica TaxID=1894989 RepID=A0A3N5BUN1_9THEO|nr:hypothetical protein [Thermodesulfitimonas autotrophica]RPF49595.1 hypothetical protein EDD75_0413 [Thermodesulfitimonas autotrophica]